MTEPLLSGSCDASEFIEDIDSDQHIRCSQSPFRITAAVDDSVPPIVFTYNIFNKCYFTILHLTFLYKKQQRKCLPILVRFVFEY